MSWNAWYLPTLVLAMDFSVIFVLSPPAPAALSLNDLHEAYFA